MRIGVFGGTFNPPHLAHLVLASECVFQLELERVLWVLTPNSPFKQDESLSPASARLKLVQAAISGNPQFVLSRVEMDLPPPQYTSVTMQELSGFHPHDQLVYLMGGDSLRDLPRWHKPLEFLDACHSVGVMRRPGAQVNLNELEGVLPGVSAKVRFVDAPLLEISASDIRRRIAGGFPYRYYLPAEVHRIIQEKGLYAAKPANENPPLTEP
jgi:nicotinate-nucleotide adenylyltransferase